MQFINKNTIAVGQYPDMKELAYDNEYSDQLASKAKEQGFDVIRLREIPTYENTFCAYSEGQKKCGFETKGTYVNFLIINKTAIIPTYTDLEDIWECNDYNKEVLIPYFEEIIQINCDALSKVGGLLNSICITE